MLDMRHMAKVLYPQVYEGSASDDAATSSRTSGASSSQSTRSSQVSHPLHREDPLYDAHDAQEQVRILAERTAQQKAQKKAAAATGATEGAESAAGASARTTQSQRAPASHSNARSQHTSKEGDRASAAASASQAQSSSSRRPSSATAASSAAKTSGQSSRNTGVYSVDEMLPNGSTSSRYGATNAASAAAKGTVFCSILVLHIPLCSYTMVCMTLIL